MYRNATEVQQRCGRPISPGGEIGRHKGLKIPRQQWRTGSIPVPGTTPSFLFWDAKWYNFAALKVYRWAVAHFLFVLRDLSECAAWR